MTDDINKVAVAFYNLSKKNYAEFWELDSAAPDYWNQLQQCISCEEYILNLLKNYINVNSRDKELYIKISKNLIVYYVEICARRKYKSGYNQYGNIYSWIWYNNGLRTPILEKYTKYTEELKLLDPNYVPPAIEKQGKGGCYVATCVYGSYDCPEVWTLRRFRDYKLSKTWNGRLFIKIYYAISPTIVKYFGKQKWFKFIFKKKLDKMVNKLKTEGYASTPYNDLF